MPAEGPGKGFSARPLLVAISYQMRLSFPGCGRIPGRAHIIMDGEGLGIE